MKPHTRQCFANHLANHWLIDPVWAERAVAEIRAHGLPMRSMEDDDWSDAVVKPDDPGYETVGQVAVISIDGPMAKFSSSFGGCNTVLTRKAVRAAVKDQAIASIVLRIDSPGGTVDGTKELADDVAAAGKSKPCYAFCEDTTASAALWVAAQAKRVYANATALVGSIGCYMVLVDSSKAYEAAGMRTIVVSSGGMKGLGADGAPVTDDQVAYLKSLVDERTDFFVKAIASGRGMTQSAVRDLADGRVHVASKAQALGLIDGVRTFDQVMAEAAPARVARGKRMQAEIDIASAE